MPVLNDSSKRSRPHTNSCLISLYRKFCSWNSVYRVVRVSLSLPESTGWSLPELRGATGKLHGQEKAREEKLDEEREEGEAKHRLIIDGR